MKSTYIISATGREPVAAAPTATAAMGSSEIGVSRTRFFPNSSTSPFGDPEDATAAPVRNLLADDEHRRVAPQFLCERFI
jgi:hypothetical protein